MGKTRTGIRNARDAAGTLELDVANLSMDEGIEEVVGGCVVERSEWSSSRSRDMS